MSAAAGVPAGGWSEAALRLALHTLPSAVRLAPVYAAFLLELPAAPDGIADDVAAATGSCEARRRLVVVSAGTGTRCVGFSARQMDNAFCTAMQLADCHAEVLARRGLLAWLLAAATAACEAALASGDGRDAMPPDAAVEVVDMEAGQDGCQPDDPPRPARRAGKSVRLRPGVRLLFYTSRRPCGACAGPNTGAHLLLAQDSPAPNSSPAAGAYCADAADSAVTGCGPFASPAGAPPAGTVRVGNCLVVVHDGPAVATYGQQQPEDSAADGVPAVDTSLACRTKPGKGLPNLNLSCSDKLARWQAEGVQGALLRATLFPDPIRLSGVFVDNMGEPSGLAAPGAGMRKALCKLLPPCVAGSANEGRGGEQAGLVVVALHGGGEPLAAAGASDLSHVFCGGPVTAGGHGTLRKRTRLATPRRDGTAHTLVSVNPKTGFAFGLTNTSLAAVTAAFVRHQEVLHGSIASAATLQAAGTEAAIACNAFARVAHGGTRYAVASRAAAVERSLLLLQGAPAEEGAVGAVAASWKGLKRRGPHSAAAPHTAAAHSYVFPHKFSLRADFLVPLR